ncbi:hypothetical protein P9112_013139 [Eukaryota sp. TZLM1-RC]
MYSCPKEMGMWERDVVPMTLNHPYICPTLDTHARQNSYCVVMPLYNCNLAKLIYRVSERTNLNPGKKLDPVLAWKIFHQLVESINYLHGRGFAHRDVKPENVLIDDNNNAVLSDFLFAKRFTSLSSTPFRTLATPAYHAPEIVEAMDVLEDQPNVEYGPAVDYFSLGVIFYEMMVGRLPYDLEGKRTLSPERTETISKIDPLARCFIEGLMSKDQDARIKMFKQIVDEMRNSTDDGGFKSCFCFRRNVQNRTVNRNC